MSDTTQDFNQFCVAAHPRLVAALAHQFGDGWLAEELAHDALIRAGDRWEHVASLSSPLGWTFRVGVNLGRSVFRRRSAERRAVARLGPAPFHHDADGADAVAVRQALQTLTPGQREAVVLRFYLRLTVQETADATGLRAGAVRSLTHRGIRRLREDLTLIPRRVRSTPMSRDLQELLTQTSVTPRRPVDVADIRDGVRRRRRTRQGLFGVVATVVGVAVIGIAVTVVPQPSQDVVLDSPPPVVASEPTVAQPLAPTTSPQSETAETVQRGDDELTAPEQVLLDAFVAFARNPGDTTAAAVPWADEVTLHLGNQPAQATVVSDNATGPVWSLDAVAYNGYVGPFDARELIAETTFPLTFSAGPHPHCASPPVPAPDDLAELRRLSIQPEGVSTCLEWFTVDLFVTSEWRVAAVSLDLWEP